MMRTLFTSIAILFFSLFAYAQPSNNDCGTAEVVNIGAPGICGTPVNGTLLGATYSGLGGSTCASTPFNDVWYTFTAPSEIVEVDILSSVESNYFTVYENACYNLSEISCFFFNNTTANQIIANLTSGETYYIKIQKAYSSQDDDAFSFCLEEVTPAINNTCATSSTLSIAASCGVTQTIDFGVSFVSDAPVASCVFNDIQDIWYDFTAPLSGVVAVFPISTVSMYYAIYEDNCGTYSELDCELLEFSDTTFFTNLIPSTDYKLRFLPLSNSFSTLTYDICVQEGPPIYNNLECANAQLLSLESAGCPSSTYVNYSLAAPSLDASSCIDDDNDVWFNVIAPPNGNIIFEKKSGTCRVALYSGLCGSLVEEHCLVLNSSASQVYFPGLIPSDSYYIRIAEFGSNVDFCLYEGPSAPTNNDCSSAEVVSVQSGSCGSQSTVDFQGASFSGVLSNCYPDAEVDLWYSFVAPTTGSISLDGLGNFHLKSIYEGTCGSLSEITCANGHLITGLVSGNSYFLQLSASYLLLAPASFCILDNAVVPPSNDDCSSAIAMTDGNTYTFDNTDASFSTTAGCDFNPHDGWFSFVAPSSGNIKIEKSSGSSRTIALYEGSCGSLVYLDCHLLSTPFKKFGLTSGATYFVEFFDSGHNSFSAQSMDYFELGTAPVNDNCVGAISVPVTSGCTTTTMDFSSASYSGVPGASCGLDKQVEDAWFDFVAPTSGFVTIERDGFTSGTLKYTIYNNNCASLVEEYCEVSSSFGSDRTVGPLISGTTYILRIESTTGSSYDFCLKEFTPLPEDECNGAINLTVGNGVCGPTYSTSLSGATASNESGVDCGPELDYWYTFTSPLSGQVHLQQLTGNYTYISVHEGSCGNLTQVFCGQSQPNKFCLIDGLTGGQVYYLRMSGNGSSLSYCLKGIIPPPVNNDCGAATGLALSTDSNCNNIQSGSTEGTELVAGNYCNNSFENAVFYTFAAGNSSNYTFGISNNSAAHTIEVFADCTLASSLGCSTSDLTILLNAGSYIVAVYPTTSGNESTFDICAHPFDASGTSGNVGIGIDVPASKLQVNGGITPGFTENQFPGTIRYAGDVEVYNGSEWKSMTEWDHSAEEDVDMGGNAIENLPTPTNNSDAATKAYVDAHEDGDASSTNELVTHLSLSGTTLQLFQSGFDPSVSLSSLKDNLGNHSATTNLNMVSNRILNLGTPLSSADATTKAYVDAVDNLNQTSINNHITADGDLDDNNEIQMLSQSGSSVTLSDGGGTISVDDADNDPTNEIETWSTLSGIPADFSDNLDDDTTYDGSDFAVSNQTCLAGQKIVGFDASGVVICATDDVDDADNDPTNEIETWSTLAGIPADFSDGVDDDTTYDGTDFAISNQSCPLGQLLIGFNASGVAICATDNVDDADSDINNELITNLSLSGTTLNVDEGANVNSIDLVGLKDNLGNHNADQNLDLDNNKLINVSTPTAALDGVNKSYVDGGITTLTNQVNDNTTDINDNNNNINNNTALINNNAGNIAGNTNDIANNTSSINTNATNIATNASNISSNTTSIGNNTSNIATNTSNISSNASNIATNTSNISSNASDIAANASAISSNDADIAANASAISSNDTDIATNAADIASNDSDIAANVAAISSNDADIAANAAAISSNDADIAANAAAIASNDTDIAANTAAIVNNDNDIATNAANISSNDGDISTLQMDLSNHIATDADTDVSNELITAAILNGTDLEITEGGNLTTLDLQSLQAFENVSGVVRGTGTIATDDFVFGESALPANGSTHTDELFFFDKSKSAFRAGQLTNSTFWNTDSLGVASIAGGHDTKALGDYSSAFGNTSQAIGSTSFAIGSGTNASGDYATSMGHSSTASGNYSTALGWTSQALGFGTTAFGRNTIADGNYATAWGFNTQALSSTTTAFGNGTIANGSASTVMGTGTVANGFTSLVVGQYNDPIVAAQSNDNADTPLFIVGNGDSGAALSNAFDVRFDGRVTINEAFTFPTSDGTSDQIMKTDASGNVTWTSNDFDATNERNTALNLSGNNLQLTDSGGTLTTDLSNFDNKWIFNNTTNEISYSLGNVGINVANPSADLHIGGSTGTEAILFDNNRTRIQHSTDLISTINGNMRFLLDSDNNGTGAEISFHNNVSATNSGSAAVRFNLDGADSYISTGGALGVGTKAPEDRLHVNSASGENAFRVQVNGVTKMRVLSNGGISLGTNNTSVTNNDVYVHENLGIGDTNPTQRLSVTGNIRSSSTSTEVEYNEMSHDGTRGIINTVGSGGLEFRHDGSTKMTLTDASRLGIGTTSPDQALSVVGTVRGASANTELEYTEMTHNGSNGVINTSGDGVLLFRHSNVTKMALTDAARLGIGTTSPDEELSVVGIIRGASTSTESEYTEMSHSGTRGIINTFGDGGLEFRHHGSTKMTLTDASRLGIGTTTPDEELSVVGRVRGSFNSVETEYTEMYHTGAAGYINTVGDGNLNFAHDGSTKMTLTSASRLGVARTTPIWPIHVGTNSTNGNGAHVTSGGTWTNGSSRLFKRNFIMVDTKDVLQKLLQVPMQTWEYNLSDEGVHMGPIAEDFYEAFGLGKNPQYISTVDADGVALAAIQALAKENEGLKSENELLKERMDRMEEGMKDLMKRLEKE